MRLSLAVLGTALASLVATAATVPADAGPPTAQKPGQAHGQQREPVRFATFNASLNRETDGALVADLSTRTNVQARNVAEIIQRTDPDVLLINEFDYVPGGQAAELFRENYLEVSQNGAGAVEYPYYFVAPSNTGVPSGFDLNNNGVVGEPGTRAGGDDSLGYGLFEGQYGMVVYSKHPIATEDVRTFQNFLWKDMPGALLPDDPATPAPADWYSPAELDVFRLSSKSHWDVPIRIGEDTVHFLVSHPTPPVFDAAEDRNGTRNHDEIRLWADYVRDRADYLYDDEGQYGGLPKNTRFVIAGDQNSDPLDGDSIPGAIQQLLDNPRVDDRRAPTSPGGVDAAVRQRGTNESHEGPDEQDTADFDDRIRTDGAPNGSGNLRVDYVLPSRRLKTLDSGIFWPAAGDPLYRLTGDGVTFPVPSSDHRLVWVDLRVK